MKTDIVIVGCGAAGLYCALNLPRDKKIIIVTKDELEKSDSFLAQGGICVLHDENDYDSFFDDTMRAGHYENNPDSVDIMIRSSRSVINELVGYGVRFEKDGEDFAYTKEGAHSRPRIFSVFIVSYNPVASIIFFNNIHHRISFHQRDVGKFLHRF